MGRTPALTVAWASVVCLLAFANGCRRLEDDEAGVCLEVLKISGVELENGQDESSLQVRTLRAWVLLAACVFDIRWYRVDDNGAIPCV